MSKGPGKQQQRILAELKKRPAFYLDELAHTRAESVSLNRAAWKLSDAGLIQIIQYYTGRQKTVVTRPGAYFDRNKYNRDRVQERYDEQNKIISVD